MPKASQHRSNLVRTTMRLFRRQGYASTGLQQILAESGAPKGSLYHYFPGGKEELGRAAVELAGDLVAEMLADLAAKHPDDPDAFVRDYCGTMAKWMKESGFRSGCPIATTMLETAPQSPELTKAGEAAIDRWIQIVSEVFRSAGATPGRARGRAQLLVASVEGALLLARIRRSTRPILDVAEHFGIAPAASRDR